jgi:hypothetical protein
MKLSQRKWVEEQLKENGEITRNQCLKNYISRLGAIICDMKADGWKIEPTRRGSDYVYTLVDTPKKAVWLHEEKVLTDGSRVRVPKLTYV